MPAQDSFFNTANLLSLSRLPLGMLFALILVVPGGGAWPALAVLGLAGLTDALDGIVARRAYARLAGSRPGESPAGTGSWLDPICDKLFVATVLIAIWFHGQPSLTLLFMIVTRELVQLPLSLVYAAIPSLRQWLRYDFRASVLGKAATVSQFAAIMALLFQSSLTPVAAVVCCAIGILALADYVARAIRIGQRRRREEGATSVASDSPRPD